MYLRWKICYFKKNKELNIFESQIKNKDRIKWYLWKNQWNVLINKIWDWEYVFELNE